jgi:hypothetical protein
MVSAPSRRSARAGLAGDEVDAPGDAESTALPLADVAELPWLVEALGQTLARHQGHAILVHGDAGIGALEFAFALARGWLCEASQGAGPPARPACGRCMGCHLARTPTCCGVCPKRGRCSRALPSTSTIAESPAARSRWPTCARRWTGR